MKPIPVTQPFMPPLDEFLPYLSRIWDSKWLTNAGEFHQELEHRLARHLGVEHLSLFANGTIALIVALQALRITGEVITTPYSFVATAHSLLWNNIRPVFADIAPHTFNLDPDMIESAITGQTTAIMPVHCYGIPCDVERIQNVADRYGLRVIYDAAHAFGVDYKGVNVLTSGDLRQGIKDYSSWPTIPQLYVKGEFVGGCDITREMFQAGELQALFEEKSIAVKQTS